MWKSARESVCAWVHTHPPLAGGGGSRAGKGTVLLMLCEGPGGGLAHFIHLMIRTSLWYKFEHPLRVIKLVVQKPILSSYHSFWRNITEMWDKKNERWDSIPKVEEGENSSPTKRLLRVVPPAANAMHYGLALSRGQTSLSPTSSITTLGNVWAPRTNFSLFKKECGKTSSCVHRRASWSERGNLLVATSSKQSENRKENGKP